MFWGLFQCESRRPLLDYLSNSKIIWIGPLQVEALGLLANLGEFSLSTGWETIIGNKRFLNWIDQHLQPGNKCFISWICITLSHIIIFRYQPYRCSALSCFGITINRCCSRGKPLPDRFRISLYLIEFVANATRRWRICSTSRVISFSITIFQS
jgi:hypothetical protein